MQLTPYSSPAKPAARRPATRRPDGGCLDRDPVDREDSLDTICEGCPCLRCQGLRCCRTRFCLCAAVVCRRTPPYVYRLWKHTVFCCCVVWQKAVFIFVPVFRCAADIQGQGCAVRSVGKHPAAPVGLRAVSDSQFGEGEIAYEVVVSIYEHAPRSLVMIALPFGRTVIIILIDVTEAWTISRCSRRCMTGWSPGLSAPRLQVRSVFGLLRSGFKAPKRSEAAQKLGKYRQTRCV